MFVAALGIVEQCTQPLYMTITHFLQPQLSHPGPENPPHAAFPWFFSSDQYPALRLGKYVQILYTALDRIQRTPALYNLENKSRLYSQCTHTHNTRAQKGAAVAI